MAFSNVNSFLEQLSKMSPKSRNFNSGGAKREINKLVEKVYVNNPNTFGRYQVLPMNSVVTDYPYVQLNSVREISIPKKNISSDGVETPYNSWVRLLPKDAYKIKEPSTGQLITSLTAEDEALLDHAYALFDQLYDALDVRNNKTNENIFRLIKRKNYVIFHGFCTSYWKTSRTVDRQNFAALFVITAADFCNAVEQNIGDVTAMSSLPEDWLGDIYNRQQTGRTGSLLFSIQKKTNEPGFNVSVSHAVNQGDKIASVSISDEQALQMSNPVETFLGYQAPILTEETAKVDPAQRKLFNPKAIQSAIDFMSKVLSAVQMARQNGQNVDEAIKATNAMVLNAQAYTNTRGIETNDPMLAQQAAQARQQQNFGMNTPVNPQAVQERNVNPYATPPAAHIDPITGQPVAPSGNNYGRKVEFGQQLDAPFSQPSGLGLDSNDDLPF